MSLEFGMNFSRNVNKITKLTAFEDPDYIGFEVGDIRGGSDNQVQINSVGYATNTFYLFKQVYGTDGMPIEGLYVDKTGEGGTVDGNDLNRYHLETPTPDFLIGLSSKFEYKNFDFSFAGRISIGNYVYNNIKSDYAIYSRLYNQSGYLSNVHSAVTETNFYSAQYKSDIYLENASFFRMDHISVGYTFDNFFTDKLNARVNFTVQNAFVITKYSGLDPEISSATAPGIDNNLYPRPRTFILGLNINF
jgi:iron complex outermembrane receptor protein